MKILYIDDKNYIHNASSHIEFVASLEENKLFDLIGYGSFLRKLIKGSFRPRTNLIESQVDRMLKTHKPDIILTYNSGPNISELYKWIAEKLSRIDIPKVHIATDYMRDGFDREQADWFEHIGYEAVFFRHKVCMDFPLGVKKFLLPLSINPSIYNKNIRLEVEKKDELVGFLGSSSLYPDLYANRIAAMNKLRDVDLLKETRFLEERNRNQMMLGDHYVKFLTNNLFNLTCGGSCSYFVAKHIQIPAAYSMLVCTEVPGLESLPEGCYIKYDKNDLEKLVEEVRFHISNKDIVSEKISILHKYVMKNCTHKVRGMQFKKIIEGLI